MAEVSRRKWKHLGSDNYCRRCRGWSRQMDEFFVKLCEVGRCRAYSSIKMRFNDGYVAHILNRARRWKTFARECSFYTFSPLHNSRKLGNQPIYFYCTYSFTSFNTFWSAKCRQSVTFWKRCHQHYCRVMLYYYCIYIFLSSWRRIAGILARLTSVYVYNNHVGMYSYYQ